MVRADAAAHGGGPRARPRDLPHARGGVRPLRGAPHRPAARGRRARQPARRQVGPPPPRSRPRLLPRQPQPAGAARRQVSGGAGGEVAGDGVRERRRGGGGRGGVVPGGGRGGHHARHVRAQLRLRPRGVPHAGPPHGLRLRGLPQGARPGLPVLADQEEPDVVGPGQGDQAGPSPAHRPAQRRRRGPRGGDQGEGQQRRLQGPAGADDKCPRQEVAGHAGGGHGGGVQDVLLRRQADDHQPADLGHGAPRHAPGVAGPRPAGGPRRVRPRRAPRQGAPAQAENAGDDPERDAEAVPTGRGHHPQGQGGRHPRRPGDPARHGAADPDHGDPPRRQVLGARRGAVQPRPVRRRRGPGGDAPAGVHPVRARVPDVRRPEPRPARGQAHRGRPAPALRAEAVAQVRARADGADAAPPAVRRARDLPPPVVAPAVRVGPR
ncbi:hypothetical protein CFC21_109972 [Triticum aestivum]|uniref:Uncharacterized protein n=2 Tax=Triticum aestivum TaxID=4565 RepID=A0A9R1MM01_WHEAT|nr:hypothetical protein CFC21_109972 [Triticum aestivum]